MKNAYRFLRESKEEGVDRSISVFWKSMWKLKVPPKVKDLLWRACSNCLPTKTILRSRHVSIDAVCPYCQSQRETISHCLVECSFAQSCWHQLGIGVQTTVAGSFASWLQQNLHLVNGDKKKELAMLCWAIWRGRNEIVWNNKGANVDRTVVMARNMLEAWTKAQDKNEVPRAAYLSTTDGRTKWEKPSREEIKINVDAALFEEAGTFSYACVARDDTGNLIEAISCCRTGNMAPEMVEVMGVREALSWVKRNHWRKVVVETDSLMVVESIRSTIPMPSYFGGVISECRDFLQSLPNVSLIFIRRSANKVAHFLARASSYVADRIIGKEDISPDFLDVIIGDC